MPVTILSIRHLRKYRITRFTIAVALVASLVSMSPVALTGSAPGYTIKKGKNRIKVISDNFELYFILRSPDQIAGFYLARGFPDKMVNKLRQYCFMTVGMKNKSKNIIWLDIRQWSFRDKRGTLKRVTRKEWFALWKEMNIPLRFQSTFRWTLIPTVLDYRPDEREGGNITLQRRNLPVTVTAVLQPNKHKSANPVTVVIPDIKCAVDPPAASTPPKAK